jgi:D-glycero-D-manno-heptose 1,7-bisphosphate phosphatase
VKRPAVFLDRDGTIIEEVGYCSNPADVRLYSDAAAAIRRLRQAGYLIVVITNQSGIGLGYFSEADYHAVHHEMVRQLGAAGIDGMYFSDDTPENPGPRRKPNPGMVLEAERDLGIDLSRSYFVGDRAGDVECGRNAGVRTVLVQTGYGGRYPDCSPDFRAGSLGEAADWILEDARARASR